MIKPTDLIQISSLNFSYGQSEIFQNLEVGFSGGKVTAIMGGSGSGKTTILKLIGGQVRPQQGRVICDQKVVNHMKHNELFAHRKTIGMLFQFGALFTDLNVYENVAFPLREQTTLPDGCDKRSGPAKASCGWIKGGIQTYASRALWWDGKTGCFSSSNCS
jgi:phospholipid/cholesterol/gamma-HCH transport system ATP-binding protein